MEPPKTHLQPETESADRLRSRFGHPWELLFLGVMSVIAAVFRSVALGRKPFWLDEGISVAIASLDRYNFARLLWANETNMSLYYVLLRGWLLFGHSQAFIRALSVVFSVATLPPLYLLARRLFDRRTALIAATLYAFNAYSIRYAQEARSYSLFVFLTTLSSLFFVASLEKPERSRHLRYIVSTGLAVYAHFYSALLTAVQWIVIRTLGPEVRAHFRKDWRSIGILAIPAILFICTTGPGPILWLRRPGLKTLYDYYDHLSGNGGPSLVAAYLLAIIAAVFPVRPFLLKAQSGWAVLRYQFLLLWLLFPVLLTAVISFALPLFLARYLIFCLPAWLILAAAGLRRIRPAWLLGAALLVLVGLSIRGTLSYYDHDFDLSRDAWGPATRYVLENSHPGDVILFHIEQGRMPYEFHKSLSDNPAAAPEVIFPHHGDRLDYRDFHGKLTPDLLRSFSLRFNSVWVVLNSNKTHSGAPDPTTQALDQIFSRSYAHLEIHTFPGVEVRLYSRN